MLVTGAIKAVLTAGLLAGLAFMWSERAPVVDAYTDTGSATPDVRLRGLNLDRGLTPLDPSPYAVAYAPDTRSEDTAAAVTGEGSHPDSPAVLWGGQGRLSGVVHGPQGPMAGATVRIERHTREGTASTEVVTNETGRWLVQGLVGGRYRVRAWVPGEATMDRARLLFLDDQGAEAVDVTIGPVDTGPGLSFTYRGDLYLGHSGTVAVSVTARSVRADGVVEISGVAGAVVSLAPTAGVVAVPGQGVTGADGVAYLTLRCTQLGPAQGVVQVDDRRAWFQLPTCVAVPPAPPPPDPGDSPEEGAGGDSAAEDPPPPPPPPVHQVGVIEIVGGSSGGPSPGDELSDPEAGTAGGTDG